MYLDDTKVPIPPYLRTIEKDDIHNNHNDVNTATMENADAAAGGGGLLQRVASLGVLPVTGGGIGSSNNSGSGRTSAPTAGGSATAATSSMHRNQYRRNGTRKRKDGKGNHISLQERYAMEASNGGEYIQPSWRIRDRIKTYGIGLIVSLNIGTDPPDVIKPHPCAKLQCWMDPSSMTRSRAKETIGERLEQQYARWQPQRAASRPLKFRKALDPTVEDVRALCLWLRRQARQERILLHYNGHGVPRPTHEGEMWVFDKNHSEYIPLHASDLRHWAGKPTIVVLDCSSAGILIPFLTRPPPETPLGTPTGTPTRGQSPPMVVGASGSSNNHSGENGQSPPPHVPMHPDLEEDEEHDEEEEDMDMDTAAAHWVKDTIVLCPTSDQEILPMHPEYPADIFTACLTTPIKMALQWFVRNNRQSMGILLQPKEGQPPKGHCTSGTGKASNDNTTTLGDDLDLNIPGTHMDRKTPLGELNWIFSAITDSIAWDMLPRALFQRLFRQDLLVASMFRNFLLADRILRSLNCTPQSYPPLPGGVADHPLWMAWDLVCERCLFGLIQDGILGPGGSTSTVPRPVPTPPNDQDQPSSPATRRGSDTSMGLSSVSSPFFSEQLTAFEVWLDYADMYKGNPDRLESPEQLPVVLQVLLFQVHRVRALELLRRFLELGPWAVNLGLSLGIFPYVLKLMQSPDYKSALVNIWVSILKFDPSCQVDLVKDKALPHFIQPLAQWAASPVDAMGPKSNNVLDAAKQRTLCALVLAATCYKYPQGQIECLRQNLHGTCTALLLAQIRLQEQQRHQQEQTQPLHRPSNDPSQFQLLSPIAREWLCLCLGNLVQACPPAQAEAYNINSHVCLMTIQQQDDDPNVRAAATYALGCLLEHVAIPTPSPTMLSSPSSASRVPASPQMSMVSPGAVGTPTPMSLGPQAFANAGSAISTPSQSFRHSGSHPQPQMFGPQQAGAQAMAGLSVPGGFPGQLQPTLSNLSGLQTQGVMRSVSVGRQIGNTFTTSGDGAQIWPGPSHGGTVGGPTLPTHPVLSTQPAGARALAQGLQLGGKSIASGQTGPTFLQQPQHALFHPQGGVHPHALGSMISGQEMPINMISPSNVPVGMSLVGSPQTGTPMLMSPIGFSPLGVQPQQQSPTQSRRRPSLFEDRRRVEFDLVVVEATVRVLDNGSPMVRYEAIMVCSNFVGKYLQAFLVVVEDSSRATDAVESDQSGKEKNHLKEQSKKGSARVIPLPRGVNQMIMDRFAACWKALRRIQHSDPHPKVLEAANTIVRVVHEVFLDMRMENETNEKKNGGLSGIAEEGELGDSNMERVRSDQQLVLSSPDAKGNMLRGTPSSNGPLNRLPSVKLYPLRRSASEHVVNAHSTAGVPTIPMPGQNPISRVRSENLLPKSELFLWKRSIFKPNYDDLDNDDLNFRDPLNPLDAARSYQRSRNLAVLDDGRKLAARYERLAPRRSDREKSIEMLLEDDASDGVEERDELLKSDLKLREKQLLRNPGGAKMVSMLRFHSFENALVVCDNEKEISVWDYSRGDRKSTFSNNNPVGSRMTTSFWINESSSSHLFVGCDDGSARIWKGVIAQNGEISNHGASLASAFFAVPGMEAGQSGKSGLICEWQQQTGTLIAGGNSATLRCWDVAAEKCVRSVDTETEACVTTLTTAWDEENYGSHVSHRGMGPDIIVAGTSNGALKVFDIRMQKAAAPRKPRAVGRKVQYPFSLLGHRSWIVDTSFSCHGGQNEILSGSVGGDMRAWDLRMSDSSRVIEVQRSPMTALSVHPKIPIAATGSHAQFIKILTLDGETLQVARFHEQMPGHRIGPVSCLQFHKQKLILAAGSTTSLVSIYGQRY